LVLDPLARPPDFIARMLAAARIEEDEDRLKEWRDRWLAYTGRKDDVLEVADGDPDDNVLVPYEQLVVNKGRSYLFGKGETRFIVEQASVEGETPDADKPPGGARAGGAPGGGTAPGGAAGAAGDRTKANGSNTMQDWLDEVWKRNWKKTLLLKYATNGGVFGHGYIKILNEAPYPRLVNLDPMTVTPTWDDEDIEKVLAYEIIYNTEDDDGEEVIHRETIEREELEPEEPAPTNQTTAAQQNPADTQPTPPATPAQGDETSSRPPGAPDPPTPALNLAVVPQQRTQWIITQWEARPDDDDWVQVEPPAIWPFEWSPVIDNQNLPLPNEYLGMSDIEQAQMQLARAIDRLLSNLNRIVRLHAHPFLYTVGLSQQEVRQLELSLDPDSLTNLPNPDADLRALEMQSDLSSSVTLYLKVKELWHEITRLPEVAVGKTENVGALSGVALEILYGPLAEATDDKHCTYGDMLIELNRRLLDLGGFGYDNWVNIEWPITIPQDKSTEVAYLNQLKTLGASEETLLAMAGLDPKREKEMRRQEAEENMKMNMQQMAATQAVAGETPQESQQAAQQSSQEQAKEEQREQVSRGSQPGSGQFGRNARR
jgi:hypothetical protein